MKLVPQILIKTFSITGWAILGLSAFFSFTLLPLFVVMAFLEPISSGDIGGQWFYILFSCFIAGVIGFALILLGGGKNKLLKHYKKLAVVQITAIGLTAIVAPYQEDPRNADLKPDSLTKIYEEKTRIGKYEGAFVLHKNFDRWIINKKLANKRLSPCSTFKVPHAIFALENGFVTGEDFSLKYDSNKNPNKSWWPAEWPKDHNLKTAIQKSVVWFFQEIARNIGELNMKSYLKRLLYGNQDISGGIDKFWLSSSLRISPAEQARVWIRLFTGLTDFNDEHIKLVKNIILIEKTDDYSLYGKTGTCSDTDGRYGAWLVGFVERDQEQHFFSTFLKSNEFKSISNDRILLTKKLLSQFGVIEADKEGVTFSFEPEIQCTITQVNEGTDLLGLKVKLFDSISNDSVQSKFTISNQPLSVNIKQLKKTSNYEEIAIYKGENKILLKINGKPISRTGSVEINNSEVARITCH